MRIKIWGARGGIPAPISPQAVRDKIISILTGAKGVDLNDQLAMRAYLDKLSPLELGTAGGNTPCVELEADGQTIILDAGSGLRALGDELLKGPCGRGEGVLHLFLSHTHWDHIQGLPFFRPIYIRGNRINIYSVHHVAHALTLQMDAATFPVSFSYLQSLSHIEFHPLTEGQPLTLGKIKVSSLRLPHPGGAYAYRFEHENSVFVYASDAEYKKLDEASLQPFVNFYHDADVLIFDAQFTLRDSFIKEDWGHSSALIGADIARRAGVKQLVLFHHDPLSSDRDLLNIAAQTRDYQTTFGADTPCEITIAYEGLTFDLTHSHIFNLRRAPDASALILMLHDGFDQQILPDLARQIANEELAMSGKALKVIADLTHLTRMNTATLRALVDLHGQRRGQPLALASLNPQVRHVIEMFGYGDFFPTYPTVPAALDALSAHEKLGLPGQMLKKRYRIENKVGESDIGMMFKATDTRLDREVAIKVLSPSLSQATTQRLLQQAKKMAQLKLPNIVTIFDADEDWGLAYVVMEYVDSQTLRDLMKKTFQPDLDLLISIVRALEYVHSKGIVHGNLKPEDIFIADEVKLNDVGLRWIEEGRPLSETQVLLGTTSYLSPEQIMGSAVEQRSDLYALGVMLYELFTGRCPFEGTRAEIVQGHLHTLPPSPRELNPDISRSMEHLILKLLAKDPEQRYLHAAQVRHVLSGLETGLALIPHETEATENPLSITPLAAAPPHPQRIIGQKREAQLKHLLKLWDQARSGRGQVVLLAGEAGIGKTYTTEELAARVRATSDTTPLFGHCSDLEGQAPYQPFIEIVRNYLARTPHDEAHAQLGESAAVIASFVPEVRAVVANLPPLKPLDPTQERARLMHDAIHFLARVAKARPRLMVLDDLHWADPASLQLFHYLARHIADIPVMLVGAYRNAELDETHPLRELLRDLSRYPLYHHITLNRLDHEGVAQLLSLIWSRDVPQEWVKIIYKRTGGNPFYVEEVAKSLQDEGLATLQDGTWHFAPLQEMKLPQSVQDIVLRRVARTRPATQETLRQAAVLGSQFPYADLLAVVNQTEEQLLENLDEAFERDLLREMDGGSLLTFSHDEVHQIIYQNMSTLWRRTLHRKIAQTLAKQYEANLAPVAAQLAHHFIQAGETAQGITYSLMAAQHARSLYAYQSAETWYSQAVALLPDTAAAERLNIHAERGAVLRQEGRFSEAIKAYDAMREAAETLNDLGAQARAQCNLAQAQLQLGDYRAALASIIQAEALARTAHDQTTLVDTLYYYGWLLLKTGDHAKAVTLGQQTLELSASLNDHLMMAQSLNLLGLLAMNTGPLEQAHAYFEQALKLSRGAGVQRNIMIALNNLGEVARLRGDYRRALQRYEQAMQLAQETSNPWFQRVLLTNQGSTYIELGEYQRAETALQHAIRMTEAEGRFAVSEAHRCLAELRLAQRNVTEALIEAQEALRLAEAIGDQEMIGGAWRVLGLIAAHTGNHVLVEREPHTPSECFEASLRAFNAVKLEAERARTLRAWAHYEQTHPTTNPDAPSGNTFWNEAREIFMRLGMTHELEKMKQA